MLILTAGNLRLCDFGWSIEVADYDTRQTICGTQVSQAPPGHCDGDGPQEIFFFYEVL